MTNNQVQIELSNVIDKDIVKIATSFSEIGMLNSNYVKELILHIKLLNEYDFDYLQNEELIDIFQILINELKTSNSPLNIAFSVCLKYLSKEEKEFEKAIFVNTFFLSSKNNMENVFLIYEYFIGNNVLELYKKMFKYVFNNNFLELEESIQIESIYKMWYHAFILFDDIEASKYAYKQQLLLFHKAIHYKKSEVVFWLYYNTLHYFKTGTTVNIDVANEELKNEVEKPLEKYITEYLMPKYSIKENIRKIDKSKKIKVAFVMQRLIKHSTTNVLYSLLKALNNSQNSKFEFILYDLSFAEANGSKIEVVNKFKQLDIRYVNLHEKIFKDENQTYSLIEKCLKTREILINDNIDVLIGLHTRVEYIFLYATRTAPKQIYWYHSSNAQYDIKGIDLRLCHGTIPNNKFLFKKINIPFDKEYYNPKLDMNLIREERKKYPLDKFIFGSIGRLIKMDNYDFLSCVADILKKYPQSIYLICGSGDKENIIKTIKELKIEDRVYFTGHINPHIYGHIIDFYLDTFPINSGEALQEIKYKSKNFVSKHNNFKEVEELFSSNDYFIDKTLYTKENLAFIKEHGYINEANPNIPCYRAIPIVKTEEEYKKVVDLILNDKEIEQKIIKERDAYLKILNKEVINNLQNNLEGIF